MDILERLNSAKRYVSDLGEILRSTSEEQFKSDVRTRYAVERLLQVSIEALLDSSLMIVAKHRARKPRTYKDVAGVLTEVGALPKDDALMLGEMIALRNLLVHRYTELDPSRIYKSAEQRRDIDRISNAIGNFLKKKSLDP